MNITFSIDEKTAEAARRVASEQGTSLNELVRRFVAGLAGRGSAIERAREITSLFEQHPGDSGGARIARDDAYEGRL